MTQEMTVMNSRNSEDFDSQLRKQLAEASIKASFLGPLSIPHYVGFVFLCNLHQHYLLAMI
jgi:hypothetical protein